METLLAAANIQTRCPNCQTVFEIGEDIVQGDDPRVRCGECFTIFNAKDNKLVDALSDDLLVDGVVDEGDGIVPTSAEIDLNDEKIVFEPDDSGAGDFADMDLFSDHAVLPEVEYLQDSDDIPELDFDTMDPEGDQFDGTLFDDVNLDEEEQSFEETGVWPADTSHDTDHSVSPETQVQDEFVPPISGDSSLEPDSIPEMESEIPDFESDLFDDNLHAPEQASRDGHTGGRFLLLFVLMAGLGGLYLYANWQNLQKTEPFSTVKCIFSDCTVAESTDLDLLRVVRRNVYSHPKVEKALVINIVFRNNATFAQAYPVLAIQMSDITGEIVAMRDFKPFEYLKKSMSDEIPMIEAGQVVDVSLEVNDPGDDAKSFELEFK